MLDLTAYFVSHRVSKLRLGYLTIDDSSFPFKQAGHDYYIQYSISEEIHLIARRAPFGRNYPERTHSLEIPHKVSM